MTLFQLTVIALVQGITEFLPISSSGHLVLLPSLTGAPDQGLAIDIAVHVGTLFAVLVYFHRDLALLAVGLGRAIRGRRDPAFGLFAKLVLATLPIIAAGYWVHASFPAGFRGLELIAWATLIGGVALWIGDRFFLKVRKLDTLGYGDALLIGLAQCIALIPGASRSGVTMTMARMLGFERLDAARFSLLLSIPAILGAGTLAAFDLIAAGNADLTRDALIAGGLAFLSALAAIWAMMRWLARASFTPFALYRAALGLGLLVWLYVYGGPALD